MSRRRYWIGSRRGGILLALVGGSLLAGLAWLPLLALLEGILPELVHTTLLVGTPAAVTVLAVATVTVRREGILIGWLVSLAFVFGPLTQFGAEMFRKEASMGQAIGIEAAGELIAGSMLWSGLWVLVFGTIGVALGLAWSALADR